MLCVSAVSAAIMRSASILVCVGLLLIPSINAQANDRQPHHQAQKVEDVRSLVLEAYGGENLRALKSVSIRSDRRLSWESTDYWPDFNEFVEDRYHYQIDLKGQRASAERYIHQNGNTYHDRAVSTPDGVAEISYPLNRVTYNTGSGLFGRFASAFRLSDTLLAYILVHHPEGANWLEPTVFRETPHYNISLTLPGRDDPVYLSISAATGYIMQLTRVRGDRKITYLLRKHTYADGVLYAKESQTFLNGELFDYEVERRLDINSVASSAFEIDEGLDVFEPRVQAGLQVEAIANGVVHVGQGVSYTTFIQHNGYVIAAGGDDGLKARYDAFKNANPTSGDLRYLIVSHDHEFERAGYKDALALGATLVVSNTIKDQLKKRMGEEAVSDQYEFVESGHRLGPVTLFEIDTVHTQSLMVSYLGSEKLLLEDDHYRPLFEGVPKHLYNTTTSLVTKVKDLGLDVAYLVSSHGAKLERWQDLTSVTEKQEPQPCRHNRGICRDPW